MPPISASAECSRSLCGPHQERPLDQKVADDEKQVDADGAGMARIMGKDRNAHRVECDEAGRDRVHNWIATTVWVRGRSA